MTALAAWLTFPLALLIAVGTFQILWRSLEEQQRMVQLAYNAHQELTNYDDATKLSTTAAERKISVELRR